MRLQNCVSPFGDLLAVPARGLLFGNRGDVHWTPRGYDTRKTGRTD